MSDFDFAAALARRFRFPEQPSPHSNMLRRSIKRGMSLLALGAGAAVLSGCQMVILDPKGPVGLAEKDLIILAVLLMLIPVIPVIVMTLWFAWRYRASNTKATYDPDFEHSNRIEAVVWAIPTLIIIALGTVTWISTHELDPHVKVQAAAHKPDAKPIEVEVVSLDWKWLFIYPQYGIATVNEMAMPVGTPVHFKLTSASVMNSFFIPQLGSQIYTMTGMQTQLSLRADHEGVYDGISANYSGEGFAGMKFQAHALSDADFDAWIAKARTSGQALDSATYLSLAKPGMFNRPTYFTSIDPQLFHKVLNGCADGSLCKDDSVNLARMKTLDPDAKFCEAPEDAKQRAGQTPVTQQTQSNVALNSAVAPKI
ncbi:ubiquinol oxidase subunit II [Asticcacaulis sp. 201]|uniref:ubiquinol oxidase subunit II n=1 Tax=Asticcacaulis sp. 201 TaxID=3028787 RepID=UPI00291694D6|nr:ubiquinol oxidase subunit II [Asticcacaulis sp. 201]MDV6332321.1 ubiquinol oxidase subunit II [Asticcacaulis sp. 201]